MKHPLAFLIGRPAAGKSTFCRYLKSAPRHREVSVLNDYDLLLATQKNLAPEKIKRHADGKFEIVDRGVFDDLLAELARAAEAARRERFTIVEFSRPCYVDSFRHLHSLLEEPYLIIYLNSPVDVCICRNTTRSSDGRVNTVPADVIQKYYRDDDHAALMAAYPGHVRLIDNATASLGLLEREAALVLAELCGEPPVAGCVGSV